MSLPITDFDPSDHDPRAEALALAIYSRTSPCGEGSDDAYLVKCFEVTTAAYTAGLTFEEWRRAALDRLYEDLIGYSPCADCPSMATDDIAAILREYLRVATSPAEPGPTEATAIYLVTATYCTRTGRMGRADFSITAASMDDAFARAHATVARRGRSKIDLRITTPRLTATKMDA
ncbi:hypothetical protein [Frigidibacter oleivorans]|uniref:hypothetical protein n=1 Tax=Frigidibacter oleivorans TaxID=2487129 RepID=UPI000F8F05C2|nr:hypothetical protein [Frigidibacter oleivorans]